jgi:site-specific recombinase XerD
MAATPGSPATRKKALAALKGVSRSAWEMGQLPTEIYQRIRGIKSPRGGGDPTGRHICREEVDVLIRVCSQDPSPAGLRDQALVLVVYATGARRAELGSLRLGDLGEDEGKLKISIRGKGNRQRSVYMGAVAASDLPA